MTPAVLNPATPSVTVVVCCYNAESTITETLKTLQEQSHSGLEILVVDDGSTDASLELVRQAALQDNRIRLIGNSGNRGTAYSRQLGLEEARTDSVMYFDADDLATPDLVSRLMTRLACDDALMGVSCYAEYFDDNGPLGLQRIGSLEKSAFFQHWSQGKLYFQSVVTLFRKSLALQVGGFRNDLLPNPEGIRYEDYAEDLDLWCRMSDLAAEGRYFVTIAEPLFRYRKPSGSLSTRNLRLMQLKMRWIKDCLVLRRAGQSERTLAEFIASRGLLQRLADWRSDRAAEFYKHAGFAYSTRNYGKLGIYLLLTAGLSPKLIRQKIKTQLVNR